MLSDGDGSAPVPLSCVDAATETSTTLTVVGGAGGTIARLDDLTAAHRGLNSASQYLRAAAYRLRAAEHGVRVAPTPPEHEPRRATVSAELDRLTGGPAGAWALSGDLASAASRLEVTARAMVEAESQASNLWTIIGGFAAAIARAGLVGREGQPMDVFAALNPGRDAVEAAVAATGPIDEAASTAALGAISAAGMFVGTSTGMAISGQRTEFREPPRTTADILARVAELEPRAGGSPSTIAIERIVSADGAVSWIVEIPGTQTWTSVRGPNVMDTEANLRLEGGAMATPAVGVAIAMHEAGIAPGEPVMLVGHSQGGMTALALANEADFNANYDIRAVMTAGTPAAGFDIPSGVSVLHLEHAEDIVPALDGAPNPAGANQTTVSRSLAASPDPQEVDAVGVADAHKIERYVATADAVDVSEHPSIEAWMRATAPFTTGVSSEWTRVQLMRTG